MIFIKRLYWVLFFSIQSAFCFGQLKPASPFKRVFVIMLENEDLDMVMKDVNFKSIADSGTLITNYDGVTHPSQPNYIATIGGDIFYKTNGSYGDGTVNINATNLVDLLQAKKVSWKAYMEDMPENNKTVSSYPAQNPLYFRKHNPFISYINNQKPPRLNYIVNAKRLSTDLNQNTVPSFCWYTPNIQNDGHTPPPPCNQRLSGGDTCHIGYAGRWLKGFIAMLQNYPQFTDSTLIVITFDESYPIPGKPKVVGPIYTLLMGPDGVIPRGVKYAGCPTGETKPPCRYNHYSLLAVIEKIFGLGSLGRNDKTALTFEAIWKK